MIWLFVLVIPFSILIIFFIIYSTIKNPSVDSKVEKNKFGNVKPLKLYKWKEENFNINELVIPISSFYESKKGFNKVPEFISPRHDTRSFGHTLVIGGSGRGKTTKLVEPILILNAQIKEQKNKPSMIIPDSKPGSENSLYKKYYEYLKSNGYEVKVIKLFNDSNNLDIHKKGKIESNFFNPLKSIWDAKDNNDLLSESIENFVQTIVPSKFLEEDSHWINSSRNIISGWLYYMIESNEYNQKTFTIANLSYLLNEGFDNVAIKILENKYNKSFERVKNQIISIVSKTGKSRELESVISTINVKITFFKREIIKIISSSNDIDFDEIDKKPTVIFIQSEFINESENIFISLFFTQITNFWMRKTGRRDLINLLDEFNNINKINNLSHYLDKGREFKVWFIVFLQSLKKFEEIYGNIDQFLSNFYVKLILGTESNFDIKVLFGEYKIEEIQKSITPSFGGDNNHVLYNKRLRESVNPFDVKTIHGEYLYYIIRGMEPKIGWLDIVDKIDFIDFKRTNHIIQNNYLPLEIISIDSGVEKNSSKDKVKSHNKAREFDKLKQDVTNIIKVFWSGKERKENGKLIKEELDKIVYKDYYKSSIEFWILVDKQVHKIKVLSKKEKNKELQSELDKRIENIVLMINKLKER